MQKTFIDIPEEEVVKTEKPKNFCTFHRYANREEDFIEVTVKKIGKKLIRCRYCEREKHENKKIRTMEWKNEKENVTDYYVRRVLSSGKNGVKGKIPEELVQATQAVIKLKNLKEKMDEPLKTCAKHGKLYKEDVIKAGKSQWTSEQQWKCRQCMKEMHARHYELNKLKVKLKHQQYRQKNPEKVKDSKRKSKLKKRDIELVKSKERWERWEKKNPEKLKENNKQFIQQSRRELNDYHIKQSIVKRTGLKSSDIPASLIEAKRAVMLLKRSVKKRTEQDKILNYLEERNGKDK